MILKRTIIFKKKKEKPNYINIISYNSYNVLHKYKAGTFV